MDGDYSNERPRRRRNNIVRVVVVVVCAAAVTDCARYRPRFDLPRLPPFRYRNSPTGVTGTPCRNNVRVYPAETDRPQYANGRRRFQNGTTRNGVHCVVTLIINYDVRENYFTPSKNYFHPIDITPIVEFVRRYFNKIYGETPFRDNNCVKIRRCRYRLESNVVFTPSPPHRLTTQLLKPGSPIHSFRFSTCSPYITFNIYESR